MRIIMRHLRHPTLRRQIVNSTVPNVRKVHPPRHKPPHTQRRSHVPTLLVTLPQLLQIRVNPVEQIRQNIPEPGRQSRRPLTEMPRHHPRDLLHRNLAGKFPRLLSPHPVAHRKKVIAILRSPLPNLPQITHLLRVNRQRQKRILIVLPHLPHMRLTRPLERQKRRPLTRRPTQNRWPRRLLFRHHIRFQLVGVRLHVFNPFTPSEVPPHPALKSSPTQNQSHRSARQFADTSRCAKTDHRAAPHSAPTPQKSPPTSHHCIAPLGTRSLTTPNTACPHPPR